MPKGIFITATGTDVGKTYISALIVKKVREYGINCGYYKPVLSGAEIKEGELVPGDCKYVLETAGIKKNPSSCASYIFKNPLSPHLAAQIEGSEIKMEKIKKDFTEAKKEFDYIVTEGAGGIACPVNLENKQHRIMMEDIIKELNLNTLIVASATLGTINYTYLTAKYMQNAGIAIKGIILNGYDENNIMCRDNKNRIEELTGIKVIAAVRNNEKDLNIEKETLLSIFGDI